jgi:hypothetical protein
VIRARHAWVLPAFVVALHACGGSKNPAGPTPNPQPPSGPTAPMPPTDIRLAALDTVARTARIEWNPSQGAEYYVVDYWAVFVPGGPVTRLRTEGPETTITIRDLPGEWLTARVKAANSSGESANGTPPIQFQIPILKDVIEALVFGTGPYGSGLFDRTNGLDYFTFLGASGIGPPQAHARRDTMLGWRPGTLRLRVEQRLTDAQLAKLTQMFAHVAGITGEELRAGTPERVETLPQSFGAGELRVIVRDDISVVCGNPAVLGCAPQLLLAGGELIAAIIYVRPNVSLDVVAHEFGHAAMGLHHVVGVQMPALPVMAQSSGRSDSGFSALEVDALQAVYRAGLRFGASRADFQARGLIN